MAAPATQGPPYASFVPGPAFASLPQDVQACLQLPGGSPHCDVVIGSFNEPGSLCAMEEYRQTAYCACVNNAQACPTLSDAKECGNYSLAYKPASMTSGAAEDLCKGATFCVNIVEALGGGDVVDNIHQSCGPASILEAALANHPVFSALAFILILALVFILGGPGGKAGQEPGGKAGQEPGGKAGPEPGGGPEGKAGAAGRRI